MGEAQQRRPGRQLTRALRSPCAEQLAKQTRLASPGRSERAAEHQKARHTPMNTTRERTQAHESHARRTWPAHKCPRAWETSSSGVGAQMAHFARRLSLARPSRQPSRLDWLSPRALWTTPRDDLIAGVLTRGPVRRRQPGLRTSGLIGAMSTCDFCGRTEADEAATLKLDGVGGERSPEDLLRRCSRTHLRAMEAKLDSEFW